MEQIKDKTNKKTMLIIIGVVVAIIVFFVARAIYINTVVDHAYDKAVKEYNKAYDKAKKDVDKMMKDYRF